MRSEPPHYWCVRCGVPVAATADDYESLYARATTPLRVTAVLHNAHILCDRCVDTDEGWDIMQWIAGEP